MLFTGIGIVKFIVSSGEKWRSTIKHSISIVRIEIYLQVLQRTSIFE